MTENIKKNFASLLGLISLDGNVNVNARNIKVEHVEEGPNGMATFYLSLNLETECIQSECSFVEDTGQGSMNARSIWTGNKFNGQARFSVR